MRRMSVAWIVVLAGLLTGCASSPAQIDPVATLQPLQWLAGTWQRTDLPAGRSGYERWTPDDGGLSGVGVAMQGGDTVFEETLRIELRDGTVVYIAEVAHNPAPVVFRLARIDQDGFVFENPAHDFPKVIAYRREGDRLSVRVSAGEKASEFAFQRRR
ncbi:DUF6265 family protein [Lysobacter sp. F6437]|uniref:DUF6265 family protein n=1 Tax=Lysobacter sp. F6437 TaxID=3459296 RepID=UPI00403DAB23